MQQRIRLSLLLLCLQLPRLMMAQGLMDGFMKGDRKASLAVTYSQETYDTYYRGTTPFRDPNLGTVTSQALTLYGIYGLGYDLDLIVKAPYIRTEAGAGYQPKQEGFQDVTAALRWEAFDYKFGKSRLSWLFALGYSMPIQNYVNDNILALGQGSKNIDGRTMLHYKSGGFFLTGQAGYIRRGPVALDRIVNVYDPSLVNPNSGMKVNVPDVTEFIVRTGFATKRVYVDVWGQQQTPYAAGTDIGPGIPFPTNAIGFRRVGGTLFLRLVGRLGLNFGYSTTLDGQNTGKLTRMSGGIIIGN